MDAAADLPSSRPACPPGRPAPANASLGFDPAAIDQSIPARFEQQVLRHGRRLAIESGRHTFSYDALNRAANRLAHALLAQRGPGAEPIALLFDHDAPMIVALLGVLK